MENITPKRRGRPRVNPPIPNNVAEGEDAPNNDIGEREAGGFGYPAYPINAGSGKGISFLELVELVKSKNSHSHRISCVIHHEADGIVTTDNLGNIRTEKGECGYQLNTGEIIKI